MNTAAEPALNIDETLHVYEAEARSTDTFGRMLYKARDHHLVSDGPPGLGCPGEAIMPGELYLASMACCAVELIEVFARAMEAPLEDIGVAVRGEIDLTGQSRPGVTLFTSLNLQFDLAGVTKEQAEELVERFKGLCPIYGSASVATADIRTEVRARSLDS